MRAIFWTILIMAAVLFCMGWFANHATGLLG